jgi:hypothetical protein
LTLQDLLRLLPSDLFRTCLARVLMVVFDVLVSHFHMVRWHEAALERHAADLTALQAQRRALADRVCGDDGGHAAQAAAGEEGAVYAAACDSGEGQAAAAALGASSGGGGGGAELEACGSEGEVAVTGRAAMELRRGTASELEEVEARTSDEAEWGLVLQAVHAGLLAGRRVIWEEAARRVGVLLSSPAAFEGEHFLQVRLGLGELGAACGVRGG